MMQDVYFPISLFSFFFFWALQNNERNVVNEPYWVSSPKYGSLFRKMSPVNDSVQNENLASIDDPQG